MHLPAPSPCWTQRRSAPAGAERCSAQLRCLCSLPMPPWPRRETSCSNPTPWWQRRDGRCARCASSGRRWGYQFPTKCSHVSAFAFHACAVFPRANKSAPSSCKSSNPQWTSAQINDKMGRAYLSTLGIDWKKQNMCILYSSILILHVII